MIDARRAGARAHRVRVEEPHLQTGERLALSHFDLAGDDALPLLGEQRPGARLHDDAVGIDVFAGRPARAGRVVLAARQQGDHDEEQRPPRMPGAASTLVHARLLGFSRTHVPRRR
jgi:hypothetical protein